MKVTVTQEGDIKVTEVFNPLVLETEQGEQMVITMRDTGFEFSYGGEMYFAKQGYLEPFHKSVRDNYLVSELQYHREDVVCSNT